MSYDQVKELFEADPSLFEPFTLPDDWLDDWIVTSTENIDSLFDEESTELNDDCDETPFSIEKHNNGNVSTAENNAIETPKAIQDYYRVPHWPATPDITAPTDCLGFYLPFHYSPDRYGIYILEEGVEYLQQLLSQFSNGLLNPDTCKKVALYFIYFHESFHHKVEMLATRWELVARKPAYIDAIKAFYNKGKGTDYWPEETLANLHSFDQCIRRMARVVSQIELSLIKRALYDFISKQPPGYRNAINFINLDEKSKPVKHLDGEKHDFYETLYREYLPSKQRYPTDIWNFGYFDYPFNKINGRFNFLLPKNSPLSKRISLNGRFLSTKDVVKKLKKSVGLEEVRKGKGSHVIWRAANGKSTTIPLKKNDMPVGTLKGILKDLGLDMNIRDFICL